MALVTLLLAAIVNGIAQGLVFVVVVLAFAEWTDRGNR
jgi:F0F1-type ATP synthase membrane subunit c/vacuolar-type H+-ATPase subunit K